MNVPTLDYMPFPKIPRLSKEAIVTEKLDGTNATVFINDIGEIFAASKNRWITPTNDNYGFAAWVVHNKDSLMALGPGYHRGEWWGRGIQRNYGLKEKRFSLFNVVRWCLHGEEPQRIPTGDPRIEKYQDVLPECCGLVPIILRGTFSTVDCDTAIEALKQNGSYASPGFMNPEGIVVFHTAGNIGFKKTIKDDEMPKSLVK